MRSSSLALVLWAWAWACTAEAQDPPPDLAPWMLARVCVSEGGWTSPDECAAFNIALHSKAAFRRTPVRRHTFAYTRLFNPRRPPSRPWLLGLGPGSAVPQGWPRQLPWIGSYLPRWRAMVAQAAEELRTMRNPCKPAGAVPWDWGTGRAIGRYLRHYPRAVRIECPGRDSFFTPWPL